MPGVRRAVFVQGFVANAGGGGSAAFSLSRRVPQGVVDAFACDRPFGFRRGRERQPPQQVTRIIGLRELVTRSCLLLFHRRYPHFSKQAPRTVACTRARCS